jgi:thiol-disulfide isomerase/thioredoxin
MRYLVIISLAIALIGCGSNDSGSSQSAAVQFEVITKGEPVELMEYVASNGITVFDFYADWCAPCKQVDKSLSSLKGTYGDKLQVYKLDLVNWESNLAKHHNIKHLPYLIVYDGNGEELYNGPANIVLPDLVRALNNS